MTVHPKASTEFQGLYDQKAGARAKLAKKVARQKELLAEKEKELEMLDLELEALGELLAKKEPAKPAK